MCLCVYGFKLFDSCFEDSVCSLQWSVLYVWCSKPPSASTVLNVALCTYLLWSNAVAKARALPGGVSGTSTAPSAHHPNVQKEQRRKAKIFHWTNLDQGSKTCCWGCDAITAIPKMLTLSRWRFKPFFGNTKSLRSPYSQLVRPSGFTVLSFYIQLQCD